MASNTWPALLHFTRSQPLEHEPIFILTIVLPYSVCFMYTMHQHKPYRSLLGLKNRKHCLLYRSRNARLLTLGLQGLAQEVTLFLFVLATSKNVTVWWKLIVWSIWECNNLCMVRPVWCRDDGRVYWCITSVMYRLVQVQWPPGWTCWGLSTCTLAICRMRSNWWLLRDLSAVRWFTLLLICNVVTVQ